VPLLSETATTTAPQSGGPAQRNDYIRACADGADPIGAPPAAAAVIRRYAPVAAAMNGFYRDLFGVDRARHHPLGGRLVFPVFAALAEFIREPIVAGTREGLAAARARGRTGGRPTVVTPDIRRSLNADS
jgi:hypothetical protein